MPVRPSALPATRRSLRLLVTVILPLLSIAPRLLMANDSSGDVSIESVTVGFGGYFKVGDSSPLFVTLNSTAARSVRVVVDAVDPDGHAVELTGPVIELPGGKSKRWQAGFRLGRLGGEMTVRVDDVSGQVLAVRRLPGGGDSIVMQPALRQDVLLWATLGHPPGFDSGPLHTEPPRPDTTGSRTAAGGGSASKTEPSARVQVVHLDSAADLPVGETGHLLQSLDALVLALGETSRGSGDWLTQLTPHQSSALRDWVRSGGHLILAAGARASELRSSPLADWLPITNQARLSDVRQFPSLETFSGRNVPLSMTGTVKAAKLDATTLDERNVLVQGADGPLMVRLPYGLGRVTFLGLDLTQPPLSNWKALDAVCRRMASGLRTTAAPRREQTSGQLGGLGITDLASQLHSALDQFAAVNRPSIWSVMGWIAAYILFLGPLDFFVVRRVLGRSMLTWVTFPLLVCVACATSLWAASRANGDRLLVRQFELVDVVDLKSASGDQFVRGRSWYDVYSPQTVTYRVGVEVASAGATSSGETRIAPRVSWSGVPEDVVGGMYRSGGLNLARRRYRADDSSAHLDKVPIPIWSSKRFEATWQHPVKQVVTSSLATSGVGRLEGTISHALPFPLEDCLLASGGRLYLFGGGSGSSLAPYQDWAPSQQGRLRDLKAYLTNTIAQRGDRTDKLREDIFLKETPYDPSSTNLDQLVRMLTFHQAAGGSAYTGLNHARLHTLDLSELMQLGRAVLVGRVKTPVSRLLVNDQNVETAELNTYVRIIVPVTQVKGDDR